MSERDGLPPEPETATLDPDSSERDVAAEAETARVAAGRQELADDVESGGP